MNFVFISPNFPHTYWQFCDRLRRNGVNVLGIGDAPYDGLEMPLKAALTEYYRVGSLEAGKDADLVITGGDPMVSDSEVKYVIADGKILVRG